jgi:hypothetical protein
VSAQFGYPVRVREVVEEGEDDAEGLCDVELVLVLQENYKGKVYLACP